MSDRILIVDDIEENLIALEALLRRLPDVEIVMARSGQLLAPRRAWASRSGGTSRDRVAQNPSSSAS